MKNIRDERLEMKVFGLDFKNPVIAASGTFGFGDCYEDFYDVEVLGGVSTKGLTLEPRMGNTGLRIVETPMGLMNSIGLENPGIDAYIGEESKHLMDKDLVILLNLGGSTLESYIEALEKLEAANRSADKSASRRTGSRLYDLIELNISCPNVKSGGMAFGMKPEDAFEITNKIKKISSKPLVVKLSPNAPSIVDVALAAEEAGADGISMVNTFSGLDINIHKRRPVFDNVTAGLSGPAIMPIALRMVRDVASRVKIPVIGMGGIRSGEDAVKFMMAGASLVQFGTASFMNPMAGYDIVKGISEFADESGIKNISEIVGCAI